MRKIPWGILFLGVWAILLIVSLTLYLQYLQPTKLGITVSKAISTNLQLSPEIKSISLKFLPNPSIIIKGATLKGINSNVDVKIAEAQGSLSWKSLFAGRPLIDNVILLSPSVWINLPKVSQVKIEKQNDGTLTQENSEEIVKEPLETFLLDEAVSMDIANESSLDKVITEIAKNTLTHAEREEQIHAFLKKLFALKLPDVVAGTSVHVRNGFVEFVLPNSKAESSKELALKENKDILRIEGIHLDLRAPAIQNGYLDLRLDKTTLKALKAPDIELTKTSLLLTDWTIQTNPIQASLSSFFSLSNFLNKNDIDIPVGDKSIDSAIKNMEVFNARLFFQTELQIGSLQKFRETPIKDAYRFFPMASPAKLGLYTNLKYAIKSHDLDIDGLLLARLLLPMNKHNTPIKLDIPFSTKGTGVSSHKESADVNNSVLKLAAQTPQNEKYRSAFLEDNILPNYAMNIPALRIDSVKIDGAYAVIDTDSAQASGELLGLYPLNPLFQGKVQIHNLSLPRWIGAARKMSGGLINALSAIKADIDVIVNKRGVFAPYFKGVLSGIEVEGLGSCANFLKPDIALSAYPSEKARKKGVIDINPIFPEIFGKEVERKKLPPPAVPARDKDDKSPSIFVDYHIDITIPHVEAWKLMAKNVHTLISPDINETPTVRVNIGNLYEGKASAFVVLNDGNNYIKASLSKVSLEEPVKRLAGFIAVRGLLNTEAEINLSGNSVGEILSSLRVQANGKISQGSFHSEQSLLQSFNNTQYRVSIKSIPFYTKDAPLPKYFQMKGDYDIALDDTNLKINVQSNAIVDFDSENGLPMRMQRQASKIQYHSTGESKFDNLFIKGDALLGYDITKSQLIDITNFHGTLNDEIVSGTFNITDNGRTHWYGKLHFDHIDFDDYLFGENLTPEQLKLAKTIQEKKDIPLTYLPVQFLARNDLHYDLTAKTATIFDCTIENLTSLLTLKNKEMRIEKTRGTVQGGGIVQAFLEAKITDDLPQKRGNILSQFKVQVENANMLSITTMRKHETLMAGNGLIQMTGNGTFQTTDDILKKLNGLWNVNIQKGYIQTAEPSKTIETPMPNVAHGTRHIFQQTRRNTKSEPSKTKFDSIMASGNIVNGLMRTDNLLLASNALTVTGSGTVDLVSEAINAKANARYLAISKIPIEISGTINDPIVKISVLNAVAGTIGNIGAGFLNIFANILKAPFDMLTHETVISTPEKDILSN